MDELIKQVNTIISGLNISQQDKLSLLVLLTEIGFKFKKAADAIEELSKERKCGKWEDIEVTDISSRTDLPLSLVASMRCSVCNRYHNEVYHYGIPTEMAHFCPYCGARMVNNDRKID